jgi:hypothetical protein
MFFLIVDAVYCSAANSKKSGSVVNLLRTCIEMGYLNKSHSIYILRMCVFMYIIQTKSIAQT